MDLSIIIVSWNTKNLLKQCLHSIFAHQPDCEFEVWVVDNASSDGSAATVREQFPTTRLVENRENAGFARANNQAMQASTGEYILLLNSDTVVQPGALQKMFAFMTNHPTAGIVGAYIINSDRTPQLCFGKFPTLVSEAACSLGLNSRFRFGYRTSARPDGSADWLETDWVLGAALLTRREVVHQVGGLDEGYFMYSEEVDLAYRAKKIGWRTYVLKTAPIVHLGHQSTDLVPDRMKAELFLGKVRYFEKHEGTVPALLLRFIFASSILAKRWFYLFVGRQAQSEVWAETWRRFSA